LSKSNKKVILAGHATLL